MMFSEQLTAKAQAILAVARARELTIATAESCTGGLVAAVLTEIAGSSDVVDRGIVTYSNDAKQDLLAVSAEMLAHHGAVSEAVARAMAEGALAGSRAGLAVAITGIAGPGGGSKTKPVGLVWFGLAVRGAPTRTVERRFGALGRSAVRLKAVGTALELLECGLHGLPFEADHHGSP